MPGKQFGDEELAAKRAAKLVALQIVGWGAGALVEEAVGVEVAVAHEVKERPVIVARAGLAHDRDDAAAVAAVLRRVVVFENPELFYRVRVRLNTTPLFSKLVLLPPSSR